MVNTKRVSVKERFEAKYLAEPMSGCWLWEGTVDRNGYGKIGTYRQDGSHKRSFAHRVAWELYRGPIPDGLVACHRCDNPACVNPDHLFLGTQSDNLKDAKRKGRMAWKSNRKPTSHRGEAHANHKLTELDVEVLRASKMNGKYLASIFGVSIALVNMIRRGERWKVA